MVDITLVELHVEDASLSPAAPFSGLTDDSPDEDTGSWLFGSDTEEETEEETTDTDETERRDDDPKTRAGEPSREVPTRALAAVGGLVALVSVVALVRYLLGGDQPDVDIETADDDRPVGVTVDDE
jgi:hypothetical protein